MGGLLTLMLLHQMDCFWLGSARRWRVWIEKHPSWLEEWWCFQSCYKRLVILVWFISFMSPVILIPQALWLTRPWDPIFWVLSDDIFIKLHNPKRTLSNSEFCWAVLFPHSFRNRFITELFFSNVRFVLNNIHSNIFRKHTSLWNISKDHVAYSNTL